MYTPGEMPQWNKMTNADYCVLFDYLDEKFKTSKDSQLHHDNRRCPGCKEKGIVKLDFLYKV